MGFDNECILNIQSLPGEYFCPVCRTLIYPSEALQSQCTHLYCKPCLTYIVATTHACPYDGYLVTEADSKPLMESNKSLADTIGSVAVYCLYHRSGCQWQGTLSDCITHCAGCSFGNSPVVCNRCGTQIIHRQVQEHAQICPGLQPQAQQLENAQAQASTVQSQAITQDTSSVASAAPASTTSLAPASTASTTTATTISSTTTTTTAAAAATPASASAAIPAVSTQEQIQTNATTYPQGTTQALTPEQWYQQQQLQYQQYYQQYTGYDPYQQQYQQYGQYQQQFYQQYSQPQMPVATQNATQGQQQQLQQPSPFVLPQPHLQHHPQPHAQPQPQPQPQATQPPLQRQHLPQPQQPHPQLQPHQHAQIPQVQAQQIHVPAQHPPHHPQTHPQTHPLPHAQVPGQQLGQVHPQPQHHPQVQPPQQHPGLQQSIPAQQHPQPQMQHPQTHPQHQPHPQPQSQACPLAHSQPQFQQQPMQLQPHPQSHPNIQPQPQPVVQPQPQYPSAHAVTGHQSYPQPQLLQQVPPGAPQQRPMHVYPQQPVQMQNQFPSQQPPQMRPLHGHLSMPVQQSSAMPTQGPHTNLHPQHQVHQHPGMRPQGPQQGLPPLQAQSHMLPNQPQQQGMPPPQHLMYPQQPVHPQGLPHVQQSFPAQPHSQQNLPQSQGLLTHPAQAVAGRPTMMVNHGVPQQSFQQSTGGPGKLVQPGMSHQSPSQSYMPRSTALQQSQLPHTGSQSTLVPVSSALQPGISDKTGHAPEREAEMVSKIADGTEGNKSDHAWIGASESAELKIPNSKSTSNVEEVIGEVKEDIQPGGDYKNISESAQVHGEGIESHAKDEKAEVPEIKLVKPEETTNLPDVRAESSHVPKVAQGERVFQILDGDPKENSAAQVEGRDAHLSLDAAETVQLGPVSTDAGRRESLGSVSEKTNQNIVSQSQISGGGASIQALQQVPAPGSLDRGQLQQSTRQNAISAHEIAFSQPGYHDRNPSQFTGEGPGSGVLQGMPPSGSAPGQERFFQHIHYGHPSNMMDAAQRPPAPDKMLPLNIPHPGPIQERRFQEPPPHPMQVQGPTMAPSQIRPHGSNFPETLPHQGQRSAVPEPFQPPPGQQPYGPYHSEVPPAGPLVPGFPTSSARAPTHLGLPQKGFPEQAMTPQGQGQGPMLPPHVGVARTHGGPPPGVYDPANALEAEAYAARRPGFPDGRQPEPPFAHSSTMKANGIPGQGPPVGGMHDSKFSHVLAEDKFRPFTEDRFRSLPEDGSRAAQAERFRQYALDHGRSIVNRKEFEEDLKQFPRPVHLDGEGAPKLDGYVSSSRPLPGSDGGPSSLPSRPLLPYQSGGPFPAGSLGPEHQGMDIRERHRPVGFPEDLGRRHDPTLAHPDLRRSVPEFGRHRMDALPPSLRSPGKEYSGLPSNRFGLGSQSSLEDFDGRDPCGFSERSKALGLPSDPAGSVYHDGKVPLPSAPGSGGLPSHFVKGVPDGPGSHRMAEQLGAAYMAGTIRSSEAFGARNLPNLLRGGEHHGPSQMRMGEPTGFGMPGRTRPGDPGFSSSYPVHGFPNEAGHLTSGDMDAFEFPRKRMPGSMGWCRICRIDCETVEGLDMHSQTREHQKMALDMVLCIKQEIAKKQRISEVNMPLEDSSKSRKASFENRGSRQ